MLQWSAFMALPFQRQMTIAFRASWAVNIFLLAGERRPASPAPSPTRRSNLTLGKRPQQTLSPLSWARRSTTENICVAPCSQDRRLRQLQVEGHPRESGGLRRCAFSFCKGQPPALRDPIKRRHVCSRRQQRTLVPTVRGRLVT